MTTQDRPILLFDGECRLCCGNVAFVIRRDPRARVRFAAMQSAPGRALLRSHGYPLTDFATMLVIDGAKVLERSTAVLRLAAELEAPWPVLARIVRLVPRPLRDAVYDVVARNRFRLFGRNPACLVPTADIAARFVF